MSIFTGAGVAIVTPMKENGEVNFEKLGEFSKSRLQDKRMQLLSAEQQESLQP